MSAYLLATQIAEKLSADKRIAFLGAIQQAEKGQSRLSSGDWTGALEFCRAAEGALAKIPEARSLLGVTKADIAAALGNSGKHTEAKQVAEQALPLIEGVRELRHTEAALHMTIGVGHYLNGDSRAGAQHFGVARQMFKTLPGGAHMVQILESNESALKRGS